MSDSQVQKVRDTLDVLLDLYADRPASKEVVALGIHLGDIPDADKTKSMIEFLRTEVGKQEIAAKLSKKELDTILAAANSSRAKRGKK